MTHIESQRAEQPETKQTNRPKPDSGFTLTRQQLAARWQISIETVKRRERAGVLRALKNGRLVRFQLTDVLAFEAAALV